MTCTTFTGKNAVDMQIVIDAMNVLHEQDKLDTFVIVSGDTDYIPLITEIAGRGKRCIVAAHEGRIGSDVKECCHEFINLDKLGKPEKIVAKKDVKPERTSTVSAIPAATPIPVNVTSPVQRSGLIVERAEGPKIEAPKLETPVALKMRRVSKKARDGGISIKNELGKSLTLFPDQWLDVLDTMEQCCVHGPVDFTIVKDYFEELIEQGVLTFSKSIVVPLLNTFIYHGLFEQPSRGRLALVKDFEAKRKAFVEVNDLDI